ncbi:MAG: sodium/proline symporter [Pseudomonadota bacterium]
MQQSTVILITLVAYKLVLIGIGLWASRRMHDETDFFLGGRKLGAWVAGLSYAASTSSAWVLLGFSGFVFTNGLSALWMLPGIWGGYAVVWLWFGPALRRESKTLGWVTPTEYLSANTHGGGRAAINALAAAMIVFCFVFYIAAQFDAAAKAFSSQFAMDYTASITLGAAIILFYSLLGGFWAVSATDTLQGAIMFAAALLVPAFALVAAGGPADVWSSLEAHSPDNFLDWTGGHASLVFAGLVIGLASIGLGTLGQPHLLSRLMSVRGERERVQGFAIAIGWGITVNSGMVVLALSGRALGLMPETGEGLFYLAAAELLPTVLAGIVIAAVLSAVMSTVDSILLSASAAISHDLGLSRRFATKQLTVSRAVMVGITLFALLLAISLPDTIFNRVLFAWSALGAAFGPVVAARVAGREPSARARIAAIVTGFSLTALFYLCGGISAPQDGPLGWLVELAHLPGDPFERFVPWLPALAILFMSRQEQPES